jgi:hypothetical protein
MLSTLAIPTCPIEYDTLAKWLSKCGAGLKKLGNAHGRDCY